MRLLPYRARHARHRRIRFRKALSPAVITAAALTLTASTAVMLAAPSGHRAPSGGTVILGPVTRPSAAETASAYRIRPGDTLTAIAARLCGNPADYAGLAAGNGITDPDLIAAGTTLWHVTCTARAPARSAAPRAQAGAAGPHPAAVTAFRVAYSFAGLQSLWAGAGGPSWASGEAARIAMCESGGNIYAHNPSGASGLWQILGLPFAGNPFDPFTNARMAVVKFQAAGGSFAPWVCRL